MPMESSGGEQFQRFLDDLWLKLKKIDDANDQDIDAFRKKAGLKRGPKQAPIYANKADAEAAARSDEERGRLEEREALREDVNKLLWE